MGMGRLFNIRRLHPSCTYWNSGFLRKMRRGKRGDWKYRHLVNMMDSSSEESASVAEERLHKLSHDNVKAVRIRIAGVSTDPPGLRMRRVDRFAVEAAHAGVSEEPPVQDLQAPAGGRGRVARILAIAPDDLVEVDEEDD